MRTAILSDLHLGLLSGGDVLRDPAIRAILFEEIAGADHVVLLGDVCELRERPLGPALESSRPFFEELGAALGEREVTIVPGNHDHRFAAPLLDELSLDGASGAATDPDAAPERLGLEQSADPSPGPTALIDSWLGPARLRIAYPGLRLREDVYVTHGHYMDAHLNLPRAECLAVATMIRLSRPLPASATPADYERVLRPLYGFFDGVAQGRSARRSRPASHPSESAWRVLDGAKGEGRKRALMAGARAGFPLAIAGVNRLLRSDFDADVSGEAIFRGGVEAASELAVRLGVDGGHMITGHSHRGGPWPEEAEWPLPGGGRLHNTGSWVFASIFHRAEDPPNAYWPGTVTWVEDEGPPRRSRLLLDHGHEAMTALTARTRAA